MYGIAGIGLEVMNDGVYCFAFCYLDEMAVCVALWCDECNSSL